MLNESEAVEISVREYIPVMHKAQSAIIVPKGHLPKSFTLHKMSFKKKKGGQYFYISDTHFPKCPPSDPANADIKTFSRLYPSPGEGHQSGSFLSAERPMPRARGGHSVS